MLLERHGITPNIELLRRTTFSAGPNSTLPSATWGSTNNFLASLREHGHCRIQPPNACIFKATQSAPSQTPPQFAIQWRTKSTHHSPQKRGSLAAPPPVRCSACDAPRSPADDREETKPQLYDQVEAKTTTPVEAASKAYQGKPFSSLVRGQAARHQSHPEPPERWTFFAQWLPAPFPMLPTAGKA